MTKNIAERIKELDFQDCKVRVLNVDSQASFSNILIQVIGEMSNKSAPHRKFVQTFVLAEQPNGYFVLNDVFRYINDEEDDEAEFDGSQEGTPAAGHPSGGLSEAKTLKKDSKGLTSSADPVEQQHGAEIVNKRLEQKLLKGNGTKPGQSKSANGEAVMNGAATARAANALHAAEAPVAAVATKTDSHLSPSEAADAVADLDATEPEKPKDPEPTPAVSPGATTPAVASGTTPAPAKPAAPKTWANLVAASRSSASVAPSSTSSTPPAASQPRAAPPPNQPAPQPSPSLDGPTTQPQQGGAGWQTAGNEHTKRQARPHSMSGAGDKETVLAYVKNVTDKVPNDALKAALQKYGELAYFDVSRQKVSFFRPRRGCRQTDIGLTELCVCRVCDYGRLQCCRLCQSPFGWRRANLRRGASSSVRCLRRCWIYSR